MRRKDCCKRQGVGIFQLNNQNQSLFAYGMGMRTIGFNTPASFNVLSDKDGG
jgi:hypothetical protein